LKTKFCADPTSSAFNTVKSTPKGVLQVLLPGISTEETKEVTFSISLAAYDFDKYRSEKSKVGVAKILITTKSKETAIREATAIADAVNLPETSQICLLLLEPLPF